jgi:sulfate permease, SulP family
VSDILPAANGGSHGGAALPEGVALYTLSGPLFFGVAQKLLRALETSQGAIRAVVLDMRAVPSMDATALVSLESAAARMRKAGIFIVFAGVQPKPMQVFRRAGIRPDAGSTAFRRTLEDALALASEKAAPPAA